VSPDEDQSRVAELEARVERLERILSERSDLLQAITEQLCDRDLTTLSRLCAGLSPLPRPGIGLIGWRESTELVPAQVPEAMSELWDSIRPAPATSDRG